MIIIIIIIIIKIKQRNAWSYSAKTKLNTIEVLISNTLSDSCTSHGELVSVNNVLREYNEMKQEIKNPENTVEYTI